MTNRCQIIDLSSETAWTDHQCADGTQQERGDADSSEVAGESEQWTTDKPGHRCPDVHHRAGERGDGATCCAVELLQVEHTDAEHCASAGEERQEHKAHEDRGRGCSERQVGDAHHRSTQVDGLGWGHAAGQPDAEETADRVTDPAGQDDECHGGLRGAQAVLQPCRCVGEYGEECQGVHEVGKKSRDCHAAHGAGSGTAPS